MSRWSKDKMRWWWLKGIFDLKMRNKHNDEADLMTRGFFSHFLLRTSWIIVFKWNNNAIRPLREMQRTETLRDPINCAFYWKGTRNGSRLTDWQVPFCRVRKWPSIISGASSSLYFTVGESVVALYSSLYYKILQFLRDFDGILNEGKLYLNLIKQGNREKA